MSVVLLHNYFIHWALRAVQGVCRPSNAAEKEVYEEPEGKVLTNGNDTGLVCSRWEVFQTPEALVSPSVSQRADLVPF